MRYYSKALFITFVFTLFFSVTANAARNPFKETTSSPGVQTGIVSLKVTIKAPNENKDVRVWIPYPVTETHQKIEDVKIEGNFDHQAVLGQEENGNLALYAEWRHPTKEERYVIFSFKATAFERLEGKFPRKESVIPTDIQYYLQSSEYIPTDGDIRKLAKSITKGKKTVFDKHTAIYDWMVKNTKRDPDVVGCGVGIVERTLASKSGKCADLSTVYVALSRAAGVPSREVFGLRLGKKDGTYDISNDYHCWAEYYLPGKGWVSTDPADVRKLMLARNLDLKHATDIRDYYFNQVDQYRISLGRGARGFYLNPRQNDKPLNYFMYPYAEVDGVALEWLAAQKALKYEVTFTKTQ